MRLNPLALAAMAVVLAGPAAFAQVVITEIHYNPAGSESAAQEWIEIYNPTAGTIDLSGWSWGDSQDNVFTGPFAQGTFLAPNEAAILLFQSPTEFATMWGANVKVIPTDLGISLANAGSATNETAAVRDASGNTVDEVNYETNLNGWPNTAQGRSIYLLPTAISTTANDIGTNWALSTDGVDGAYTAFAINPAIANATFADIASPGVVVVASTPSLVTGDFGGAESPDGSLNTPDGEFNEFDVEGFLLALNDQAAYLTLNPTLGESLTGRGDFGGADSTDGSLNTPDGEFNEFDVEGFLLALNDPAGYAAIQPAPRVAAIPEPAALGLLAPMGLMLARRRR